MFKENLQRSFWYMIKFWGISEKAKSAILRPIIVYISLTLFVAYFSNSFDFSGIIKTSGFTIIAVVLISTIIFVTQFLFISPYKLYNDLKNECTILKNKLDLHQQKQNLASALEDILHKYEDFHYTQCPHPAIYDGHPAYNEIIELLTDSKIVLPKIISCFKVGELPDHLKNRKNNVNLLDTRWHIIDNLRDQESANFFS